MRNYKAIIVGAGIGGIASAIRLAAKGYIVDVYEANSYPGGKLSEFSLKGFRFDAGPSLFTMPEKVDELFTLSGDEASGYFNYDRLEEVCAYFYEDGTKLTAYADKVSFAKEAQAKTGVRASDVVKHLNNSRYIYNTTAGLFIEKSLHRVQSFLSLNTFLAFIQIPFLNIFTSMHKANQRALKNDKMVQLFNRYATYNGSDPYRAPGILNIIPHLEFGRGAYFPRGGMIAITKSLSELALRKGVKFHFNSPVDRILIEGSKVKGIKIGNEELNADILVCNTDVVTAYRTLMPDQKQPEKILSQERSSSALIFYWGINKEFDNLKVHNIFFSSDYKKEFDVMFKEQSIPEDPTVYIHISSKMEKGDAPRGMENWFVMINVPSNQGQDWDSLIAEARERILKKLTRLLKTDIEELIVAEDFLDPRSIESKTSSFQGALYGTSSNSRMAAFFRHPNFSRRINGLYFCGGSVHPGGGIPLALSSAKIIDSIIKEAK